MGLHDEISADIKAAFDIDLSDAVTQFEAFREVKGQATVDDWLTNTVSNTDTTLTYGGRGVFGGYSEIEIDNQSIMANDVKLVCLQDEVSQVPKLDDIINGYRVVAIQQDPASVGWTIQLRRV